MVGRAKGKGSPKSDPLSVRVYVEGGGNNRAVQSALRQGFANLFAKDLGARNKPTVIACGGRDNAYREFTNAIRCNAKSGPESVCLLLVDSEGAVDGTKTAWEHVQNRSGDTHWRKPDDVADEQLHLMVQTMESWFSADKEALVAYYGKNFDTLSLTQRADIENIPKDSLEKELKHASRNTPKGAYEKSHGFEIIGLVDPIKICAASPRAAAFFDYLKTVCPSR